MGKKGGNSQPQQVTSKTQPLIPPELAPYIKDSMRIGNTALRRYASDFASGAADLVKDFNPFETQAHGIIADRAGGAGGFMPAFEGGWLDMAKTGALSGLGGYGTLKSLSDGDYLHGGAGFNAAMDAAGRDVQQRVNSIFGGNRGGTSSGLAQTAMAQGLSDSFAGLYGQNMQQMAGAASELFRTGADRTGKGLSMLPEVMNFQPGVLSQLGGSIRGLEQAELAAQQGALMNVSAAAQGQTGSFAPYLGQTSEQNTPIYGGSTGLGLLGAGLGIAGGFLNRNNN